MTLFGPGYIAIYRMGKLMIYDELISNFYIFYCMYYHCPKHCKIAAESMQRWMMHMHMVPTTYSKWVKIQNYAAIIISAAVAHVLI